MKGLTKEIDQEIAKNKPASIIRLMWQGVKAMFTESNKKHARTDKRINELEKRFSFMEEAYKLRDFVNSPDNEHRMQ